MSVTAQNNRRGSAELYIIAALAGALVVTALLVGSGWLYGIARHGRSGSHGSYSAQPGQAPAGGSTGSVRPVQDAIIRAVDMVSPAVVNIHTVFKGEDDDSPRSRRFHWPWPFDDSEGSPFPHPEGEGSGAIIDAAQGYIVTNAHVVRNATKIQVTLPNDHKLQGELVGLDRLSDIAVVRIPGDRSLPEVKFGRTDHLKPGMWVIAIGNPFGYENSVTVGVISSTKRVLGTGGLTLADLLQTDAAINPGNSGGPLVDLSGNVIGINTAIYTRTGGHLGIGFAIKGEKAGRVAESLIAGRKVQHPYIGVTLNTIFDEDAKRLGLKSTEGALVAGVVKNSPAAAACLKKDDVVIAIDGQPMRTVNKVVEEVRRHKVGDKLTVTIIRSRHQRKIRVTVGDMQEQHELIDEDDE